MIENQWFLIENQYKTYFFIKNIANSLTSFVKMPSSLMHMKTNNHIRKLNNFCFSLEPFKIEHNSRLTLILNVKLYFNNYWTRFTPLFYTNEDFFTSVPQFVPCSACSRKPSWKTIKIWFEIIPPYTDHPLPSHKVNVLSLKNIKYCHIKALTSHKSDTNVLEATTKRNGGQFQTNIRSECCSTIPRSSIGVLFRPSRLKWLNFISV